MTPGVDELRYDKMRRLCDLVKQDTPEEGNDPYDERDFGVVQMEATKYFWKIDYYDKARKFASPDAADPLQTYRVLTIMRADEY